MIKFLKRATIIALSCIYNINLISCNYGGSYEEVSNNERNTIEVLSTYESESYRRALNTLAEEYSKIEGNPIINIKNVSQSNFKNEICIAKDEKKLPDLIICDSSITQALVAMDIYKDLSEYMNFNKISEFFNIAYNTTLVNGKSYAVPFTCDPYVLFYNENYIENNNITIPITMKEFIDELKGRRSSGRIGFGFSVNNKAELVDSFLQIMYSFGATIRELDSENSKVFYSILKDMINWNQNDIINKFSTGEIITCILKLSSISTLEKNNIDFKYKVTEIPYGIKPMYLYHGDNIGVTVSADYDEAIKFIDYITSTESVEKFVNLVDCISVRHDYFYNPGVEIGLSDSWIDRQIKNSQQKSSFSSWFMIYSGISENIVEFLIDTSMDEEELAIKLQGAVKDAIMER